MILSRTIGTLRREEYVMDWSFLICYVLHPSGVANSGIHNTLLVIKIHGNFTLRKADVVYIKALRQIYCN